MKKALLVLLFLLSITGVQAQTKSTLLQSKNLDRIVDPILPQPHFPGGENSLHEFIAKNLKWPSDCGDVQGNVYVSFIVEKNGRLTNIKIIRGLCPSIDAEAIRVIKKSPRWIPAIHDGRAERARMNLPISFVLTK